MRILKDSRSFYIDTIYGRMYFKTYDDAKGYVRVNKTIKFNLNSRGLNK
jgi:hypothetical protein